MYVFKRVKNFIYQKFVPVWTKIMDFLRKLCMLLTFFIMIGGVVSVAYFLFLCYSPCRVLVTCLVLLAMVFVNKQFQS